MSGLTGEKPSEGDGVAEHSKERKIFPDGDNSGRLKITYLHFDTLLLICYDQLRCLF